MFVNIESHREREQEITDKQNADMVTSLSEPTMLVDAPRYSTKFGALKVDLAYYCPLECDHCLFEASPSLPLTGLTDNEIVHVIQSAAEVGTFYSISIGHQEPFVQFGRLCEILDFLRSNFDGFGVSLNTTATWVKSRDFALERLAKLKQLRVETLMISVDDFHQGQVPLEKCITCASVAQEVGIHVIIQCIYKKDSNRLDYYRAQMEPYLDGSKIDWVESAFCPSGRARKAIAEDEWPKQHFNDGSCNVMEVMYVAPDGNVTPCCGGGLVASGLIAGNLRERTMAEIVAEVEQDPIFNSLAIYRGPEGLIRTLQEQHPTWRPREHYTGKCHACYEIMNDQSLVEFLRKSYEERKVDLLLTRLYMETREGLFAIQEKPAGAPEESK